MSRAEVFRTLIVNSYSPLENHSLNQKSMRCNIQGEKRIETPRKIIMSQTRRERLKKEKDEHNALRLIRITERVRASFNGYDGFDFSTLFSEIRHLRNHGINLDTILSQSSKQSEETA